MQIKKLAIIINPSAGQDANILNVFNDVFTDSTIDWDVFITKKSGDACTYAKEAIAKKYDAVGVYGGDGTVREVASALVSTNMPMAILPGGTANVFSIELGIPTDLNQACKLLTSKKNIIRKVDVGKVNNDYFILRIGIGFEALMIKKSSKILKRSIGSIAYFISAVQALIETRHTTYTITADNETSEYVGISCIVANSSNLGLSGFSIVGETEIDDGLFDIIIFKNLNPMRSLLKLWRKPSNFLEYISPIKNFQAKKISITLKPAQEIQCDGEILKDKKLEIEVVAKALKVIVPR